VAAFLCLTAWERGSARKAALRVPRGAAALISVLCLISGAPMAGAGEVAASGGKARRPLIDAAVVEASQRFGLPTSWIRAVMSAESAGRWDAVSPKGAMGLMQLMPGTWRQLRDHLGLGADPFEPRDNILAGAAYLRELHDRFGAPGFLAAYNAGPERYRQYVAEGRTLPTETRNYVVSVAARLDLGPVIADRAVVVSPTRPWTVAPLFARDSPERGATGASSSMLFASSVSSGAR
jgi:soluble lytic murein transglycosylase-like protein